MFLRTTHPPLVGFRHGMTLLAKEVVSSRPARSCYRRSEVCLYVTRRMSGYSRPDIVFVSEEKDVIVLELTVLFNSPDSMSNAHSLKTTKY